MNINYNKSSWLRQLRLNLSAPDSTDLFFDEDALPMPGTAISEAYLNRVNKVLLQAESTIKPASLQSSTILDELADRLSSLQKKGFSFDEMSLFLRRCKLNISSKTIKDYFLKSHTVMALDLMMSGCNMQKIDSALDRYIYIENGLKHCIAEETGFFLYYQPQVDITTGEVVGAEALLRWLYNDELIYPSEFIPIAESTGLILPLGDWILREASKELQSWRNGDSAELSRIKMSVNLSVKQLSVHLPARVKKILSDFDVPASQFGLEITESFLAEKGTLDILDDFRSQGLHLSIDDFGTGYSCLAQLKDMPVNTIKIDRAFVKDLGKGYKSSAMVEVIIEFARKLGMQTLAEGVETQEQAEALIRLGCSVCQGFLYARPLSSLDFSRYVRSSSRN